MTIEDAFDMGVKITNLKTGEVTIMPPELVDKALEMAKEEWLETLLHGYYRGNLPKAKMSKKEMGALTPGPKPSPPE